MKPISLQKGDTILIIAPAKRIEKELVDCAVKTIESNGFRVIVSENCLGKNNYFSGTLEERQKDLQWAINHPTAKAILCARGGYGSVQIVEKVDWSAFIKNPKWIIGFSDITIFHQFLSKIGIASLHATVPLNFPENTPESLASLFYSLENAQLEYGWKSKTENITGETNGRLIGGNLTVLTSLIGTNLMPDYNNTILFIEDIGEALYAVDRCFQQLSKAGILKQINGLIVGGFSSMKDSEPAYGNSLEEIIKSHFLDRNIPVAFEFPAGHCDDNRALIMREKVEFKVQSDFAWVGSLEKKV